MSSPAALPEPSKLQKIRENLRQEWTGDETVAAWRKWHVQIAAMTHGVTEILLDVADLRPGLRVLDLASGVGDPALSIASAIAPSGHVTATDLGPGMISLAAELARNQGIANIEFREANAESLPFSDSSYDRLTCRFGVMFFPDLARSLRECLRVLKPGGRAVLVAWGKRDQPLFSATVGVLLKHVPVPPPPPDPDAPNLFMFSESGRLRRAMEAAGFGNTQEEVLTVAGRWAGSLEEFWVHFSEIAAPFRPLLDQLTPERKAAAMAENRAALQPFWSGKQLTLPLEIVVASATRP